ncbi:MAG: hypothetical protein JOY81_05850 [Alphaproteobacteria bacterium]|nr:hypothetical protein [Alphaproteobacteria bacterium]
MQDEWKTTEQYRRVDFRAVYTASWRQVIVPKEWPDDLRPYLEQFLAEPERWTSEAARRAYGGNVVYGSPRFYVVRDGKLVFTDVGIDGWTYGVAPKLKQLVGA